MNNINMQIIAHMKSDFSDKFGIPRQSGLVEDLMSTLITAADDVKFQIEFNPDYIQSYRKIGYENRNMANADFADDTKDGGEVGYGHSVTVVYEIGRKIATERLAEIKKFF